MEFVAKTDVGLRRSNNEDSYFAKKYSDEVINLTCKRAMAFGITHYQKIKKICESGCYQLPLSDRNQVGVSRKH